MSENAIIRAARFAHESHAGQVRNYGGEPYIMHPLRVAGRVALLPRASEPEVCAAWLHDVREDCGVSDEAIRINFGDSVAGLVGWLTNPSKRTDGVRAARMKIDRDHIRHAPPAAKRIKMLDRIDNLRSMTGAPESFRGVYWHESSLLLAAVEDGDAGLAVEFERALDDFVRVPQSA